MLTVNKLIAQGRGLAPALVRRAATVELPWDQRQKSRLDAVDSTGRVLGIFLPRGSVLRGGDVLVAEDGSLVAVQAAPQPVLVVRAGPGTGPDLLRAAYHLGNRHVALQVQADQLKLEPDHVLADMLRAMGLQVSEEASAFEPESGAYASAATGADHGQHTGHVHAGGGCGHDHDHDHGHGHGHTHAQGQAAEAPAPSRGKPLPVAVKAAPAGHVHGPGCGHDHGGHGH